jgi:hypothetical protein
VAEWKDGVSDSTAKEHTKNDKDTTNAMMVQEPVEPSENTPQPIDSPQVVGTVASIEIQEPFRVENDQDNVATTPHLAPDQGVTEDHEDIPLHTISVQHAQRRADTVRLEGSQHAQVLSCSPVAPISQTSADIYSTNTSFIT